MLSFTAIAFPAVVLLVLTGCSSVASRPSENGAGEKVATADVISVSKLNETNERSRLARLWERRQQERFDGDYPIGAGDVIEVNVAGMEEIKNSPDSRFHSIWNRNLISALLVAILQAL